MKKRLWALALALPLLLSGCAPIFQRPYSSSVEHVELSKTVDSSVLRAETYRGLVDAILYFVNAHAADGVVRLYNYTGSVEEDLDAACQEVLREDPLAAFAVEDISCECARIVSYYEVTVTLAYSHTADEVDAIQFVAGSANLRQELCRAMEEFSTSVVLRLSYFAGDADDVRSLAVQAYYDTPLAAFGMPEFEISVYPESGTQRIVEVDLQWPMPQSALRSRSAALLELADNLLAANPPADGEAGYAPEALALLLRQTAAPMDPAGVSDPYGALRGDSANQLAHTLALELLLQQAGMETTLATGRTAEGDACWLMVNTEAGWRHLLPTEEEPMLYTDLELTALGYLWNTEAYPACVDYNADLSGAAPTSTDQEGSEPAEGETPEESGEPAESEAAE